MSYISRLLTGFIVVFVLVLNQGFSQEPIEGIPATEIQRNGISGWQFLKINVDAKSAAMGNTMASIGRGDASSVFANPSAIVGVENMELYSGTMSYVADISYNALSFVKNLGSIGYVGFSVAALDMGDIPETINSPIGDRTEYLVTGRNYSGGDLAAGLTFARQVSDKLSVGMNARYIQETIDDLIAQVQEMGGSMEYCHGVGLRMKGAYGRELGAGGRELIRRLKTALDPSGILNPGKLLD